MIIYPRSSKPVLRRFLELGLSHKEVSVVIPGCKNVTQVEQNVTASDVALSPKLIELVRSLRQ